MVVETEQRTRSGASLGATSADAAPPIDTVFEDIEEPRDPNDGQGDDGEGFVTPPEFPTVPPLSRRVMAGLIDIGLIVAGYVTLSVWMNVLGAPNQFDVLAWIVPFVFSTLHLTIGFKGYGSTVGKFFMGLRVVDPSLSPLSYNAAFTRSIAWHFQLFTAGLPFVTILFSADRLGIHCRLSGSHIIDAYYRAGADPNRAE